MTAATGRQGSRIDNSMQSVRRHRKMAKRYFGAFLTCALLSLLVIQIAPAKPTLGYRVIGMAFAGGMSLAIAMLIYQAALIFTKLFDAE